MILFGFFQPSFWGYLLFTLIMTHITVISVTLFLHRNQAHKAMDLHPLISHFFRFWLWLTTGIVTKEWVAIHRKHHAECETENDPHSPQILGLNKVLFEGAELYQEAAKDSEMLVRYGRGTPNDWLERSVYSKPILRSVGITLMFLINVLLFGLPGVAIWAVQMMWIPFFAAGVINGIGHYFGYRNFECPDASRNIIPFGIIMGGEELHNNHHTFAASAKLSVHKWEFDIGWLYLSIFKAFGLAKVHRAIPRLRQDQNKKMFDTDSLKAIIAHRFQIMDDYWREVILPVVKKERKSLKIGKNLSRANVRLLKKEECLIKQQDRSFLQNMLCNHPAFETIYRFRLNLQDIWFRNYPSQEELLDTLNRWCKQAEATGIGALQAFAQRLRYYSIPAVPRNNP